jgi:hypothetical protein
MPITVNCACGESMRVKEEWAGRRARCPMCKQPLTVPDPAKRPAEEDEEVIDAVAAEEEADPRVIQKPKARPGRKSDDDRTRRRIRDEEEVYEADLVEEEPPSRVTTKPKARPRLDRHDDEEDDRPRRRRDEEDEDDRRDSRRPVSGPRRVEEARPRRRRKTRESGGWGIHISAGVLGGLGMMAFATVWFVVGLYAGWIYFYPPILFIAGLVAFVKGLMGVED